MKNVPHLYMNKEAVLDYDDDDETPPAGNREKRHDSSIVRTSELLISKCSLSKSFRGLRGSVETAVLGQTWYTVFQLPYCD